MNILKIRSFTDVITNSSSEVFTVYNKDAIKNIKQLVNAILAINDQTNQVTFDDIFNIGYSIWYSENDDVFEDIISEIEKTHGTQYTEFIRTHSDEDDVLEKYFKENNLYDTVIKVIDSIDDEERDSVVHGLYITAKDNSSFDEEKVSKAVSVLNYIDSIFEQYVRYC